MPESGLPFGWIFYALAGGTLGQIVIPAGGAGVSRVLTHITAGLQTQSTVNFSTQVQVLDGATSVFLWTVGVSNVNPNVSEEIFDQDLVIVGSPATAMTVQFTTSNGGVNEQLRVSGYDI
jgi:hypothetical protein